MSDADKVAERLREAIAERDHITRTDIPRYIRALLDAGWSESRIARDCGINRMTVRKHNPRHSR